MRRTKLITIVVIAALALALVATNALAQRGGRGAGVRGERIERIVEARPVFTDEQKEEIKAIHERYEEERVELSNRIRVLRMEMNDLLGADEPDFDDIEDKLEAVHAVRLEQAKLRLRIHQDVRPLLSDDQRALFDRGFGRMGLGMMRGDGPGMMDCGGRPGMGQGMCHGRGTGSHPMRGGRGMGRMASPPEAE